MNYSLFTIHYSLFTLLLVVSTASAATYRVENVCRLKGQEQTMIRGYGIVSGLNATGDDPKAYGHTARAILSMLRISGLPGGTEKEVGSSRNNALVEVIVTIPETGGREGDLLDCTLLAVGNAKSIENGVLTTTMLMGPIPVGAENAEVYGMAWGPVTIEREVAKNVGKIKRGCRLTSEFKNPYIQDGTITLVINREFAAPRMARDIAQAINERFGPFDGEIATATHQNFVVVKVRDHHFANPIQFLADLMDVEILMVRPPVPRVVINERTETITIDEDVEVKPSLVTHREIVAEIRPPFPAGQQEVNPQQFVDIDTEMKYQQFTGGAGVNQKLKALQASLDAVRIPPRVFIDIIKNLQRQGAIIGDVIYVE
jgi:flagellar P-ring protein precursor FlgI